MTAFEERSAQLKPLSVDPPEAVSSAGIYGAVVLTALITGDLDGKVTLTMDWTTAFLIAEDVLQAKVEGYNPQVQAAVESVFYDAAERIANHFAGAGLRLEIRPMPTITDTDVLLAEEDGARTAIKLPLTAASGAMNLFLAFP